MELWIRSTARTNLLKARFLTIMEGNNFYKKNEWEFKGYTICNCTEQGNYELLGSYVTKERALEVLDEIQNHLLKMGNNEILTNKNGIMNEIKHYGIVYEMPKE